MAKKSIDTDKAASERVVRMTSVPELKKLVALKKNVGGRMDSAKGELGAAILNAVESKHLHKGAFAAAYKTLRMGEDDPVKLRQFIDAREYYEDVLGVHDKKAADLFKDKAADTSNPNGSGEKGKEGDEKDLRPRHMQRTEAEVDELRKKAGAQPQPPEAAKPH